MIEKRHIAAQRIEAKTARVLSHRRSRRQGQAVRVQRPKEDPDILDVVTSSLSRDATDIGFVSRCIEGTVQVVSCLPIPQVRRVVVVKPDVVHVLGGR